MPHARRQARVLAMQALCQWEVQQSVDPVDLDEFLLAQVGVGGRIDYAGSLVRAFWSMGDDIDERISAAADRWELPRLSMVDRNVMRIAVTEMLLGEIPPPVAIDEAIEIGKEFGAADSPRFINGVLDKVRKGLPEPLRDKR